MHDLLLRLGDLSVEEIDARSRIPASEGLAELLRARRAIAVNIAGESRALPVEYAAQQLDLRLTDVTPTAPVRFEVAAAVMGAAKQNVEAAHTGRSRRRSSRRAMDSDARRPTPC